MRAFLGFNRCPLVVPGGGRRIAADATVGSARPFAQSLVGAHPGDVGDRIRRDRQCRRSRQRDGADIYRARGCADSGGAGARLADARRTPMAGGGCAACLRARLDRPRRGARSGRRGFALGAQLCGARCADCGGHPPSLACAGDRRDGHGGRHVGDRPPAPAAEQHAQRRPPPGRLAAPAIRGVRRGCDGLWRPVRSRRVRGNAGEDRRS